MDNRSEVSTIDYPLFYINRKFQTCPTIVHLAPIFNTSNKYVATIDENKKEVKHLIESLNDLYKYSNEYFKAIDMYDKKELSL